MGKLVDRIREGKILISDGAWGTFLHQKGLKANEAPESWNLTRPDDVYAIARSYVESGADLILTNSFGGSPVKLAAYGLEGQCYAINKAAAEISRKAAGEKILVLGSVGPSGKMVFMGEVEQDALLEGFRIQAEGLEDGGADAILVETMSDPEEARIAIEAARQVTDLEVICTFTFTLTGAGEYRTLMGTSPVESVQLSLEAGASVIGANCGNGTAGMIEIVKEIRAYDPDIPVLVHANAGLPVLKEGESVFPETPEEMAVQMKDLVAAGADIVGGCCGTTPDHIRRIVSILKPQ